MNHTHRRALGRKDQHRITREHFDEGKTAHNVPTQLCALWIPEAQGYLSEFSPRSFRVVKFAELARHYAENEATSAAVTFREITGLRVVIRPVYLRQVAR